MSGLDKNMLLVIECLAKNRIQDAKKAAIACCANDTTKKNQRQINYCKNLLNIGSLELTTLPANLYVLPADCKIRKGLLTDTIYVTLKNDPILKTETKVLALQVVEANAVKQGDYLYSRALISVTDRLFKPDWWLVNDAGTEENPGNSVDWFYLGEYSEKKYQMFLDELKKDDMVFDGKNKQVLRKYSLRLKNTLKQMNEGKNKEDWVKDEHGNVITVEVAG